MRVTEQETQRQVLCGASLPRGLEHAACFAGRQRHNEGRVGDRLMNPARGLDERVGHVLQLGLPAARQQGEDRLPFGKAQQRTRRVTAIGEGQHVGKRVTDVADRNPLALVDRWFEGKQCEDS
ncbi:MAG: hypothetical protein AW12_00367 [Candidatus Accumulibacter sp. BA-94]|nr:MAG: hypothetical protein AW12_00367 [Candidatus Accumulibacter sp. BA-94]